MEKYSIWVDSLVGYTGATGDVHTVSIKSQYSGLLYVKTDTCVSILLYVSYMATL